MFSSFDITWWETFIAGIATLAIYSFLFKENPFYRFFEHLFIGIATGITVMKSFRTFLWQEIFKPLFGQDIIAYPDGSMPQEYNYLYLLYLIPMGFGLLYYFILTRKYSWLAQVAIGLSLGVGGGLAFKGFFNEMLPQLYDSFRPLYIPGNSTDSINNLVFMVTLITVLSYFFFTFKRTPGGLIDRSSNFGRWMMMGCFGAFFGSTIMARMALLVERLDFLINTWWPNLI